MYTWEMVNFINERNRYIGGDDLLTILSLKLNPQITYIKFFPTLEYEKDGEKCIEHNIYLIKAHKEGSAEIEELWFKAMPYEEAKAKGLVKRKIENKYGDR